MKKIFVNSVVILVAAALGLTIGFALRPKPKTIARDGDFLAGAPNAGKLSRAARLREHVRLNDDSPLTTKLQRDLSMSSGVTRWLYWIEAIEKAQPADFPRLFQLARNNSTARRFVAARWVEVAPRHLFDTLVANAKTGDPSASSELASTLFTEWPKRDPDAAIAALNETNSFGHRENWQMSVATSVLDVDPERGLRLLSEWHIENYGPNMKAVAEWAAANPRHAAQFALDHPAGYATRLVMETIGKEWAKSDPAAALAFAEEARGEFGSLLATSALKEWAGRNLNEAAQWLAAADDPSRNRLSPAFVETWAKTDVGGALTWCQENLSGSALAQAVGGVLKGAAAKDVANAAAIVSAMEPSAARTEAAAAVAQKWFPESFSGKPVPPETIAWLSTLDADSLQRTLEQVYWRWSDTDPTSMAEFLASAKAQPVPEHAYSSLARHLARKNPEEALQWAARLPGDRAETTGSMAFSEWRRSQPDNAFRWLEKLPAADPRREAFFQTAIGDMAHEPHAAAQLAGMNSAQQAAAKKVIETMSLPQDRRERLLSALASK